MKGKRGLFVTHRSHVGEGKGGVQRCTDEYMRVIRATGIELDILEIAHDQRLSVRLARRFYSSPYFRSMSKRHLEELAEKSGEYDIIFFNQVNLAGSLRDLKLRSDRIPRRVLLSHGAEITDLLHLARLRIELPLSGQLRPSAPMALGAVLRDETEARKHVDAVIALSQFDAEFEVWLGSKYVTWLPRIVEPGPLEWRPSKLRFGHVGTLDHAPNLEGLVLVLEALRAANATEMTVRIVGGPERIGIWLRNKYANVDYLGPIDDAALRAEAAGWRAFLHPIFCQARGCSTKLAMALGWQIPVITTPLGRRGYVWQAGELIEATTPAAFVEEMQSLEHEQRLKRAQMRVVEVARSSPRLDELASQLMAFLHAVKTGTDRNAGA